MRLGRKPDAVFPAWPNYRITELQTPVKDTAVLDYDARPVLDYDARPALDPAASNTLACGTIHQMSYSAVQLAETAVLQAFRNHRF